MDRGAWRATVHGVAKSWIRLSNATTAIQQLISMSTVFKARVTDSHLTDSPKAMPGSSSESMSFQRSMAVRNL